MSDCLSESDLHRYHARELADDEAERVRAHLAACEACRDRNAVLEAVHHALLNRVRAVAGNSEAFAGLSVEVPVPGPEPLDAADTLAEGYDNLVESYRDELCVVYRAVQRATKQKVAVKVMHVPVEAPFSQRRRLELAELTDALRHPNIVTAIDSGVNDRGHPYIVTARQRGLPIDRHVHRLRLPLEHTLELFIKLCDAVNSAHRKGIIHAWLKPSSILVNPDHEPKVLDFGLLRMVGWSSPVPADLGDFVMGGLPYISPEQTNPGPAIDIRTDVYSLGVILYELLTGHFPYAVVGGTAEVIRNIAEAQPAPIRKQWSLESGVTARVLRPVPTGECPLDEDLEAVVLRALVKDRSRRYPTAGEFGRDLDRYLAGETTEARRRRRWGGLRDLLRRPPDRSH
jgi:serine/threonine protein kinase